jgi:hypothetical protein
MRQATSAEVKRLVEMMVETASSVSEAEIFRFSAVTGLLIESSMWVSGLYNQSLYKFSDHRFRILKIYYILKLWSESLYISKVVMLSK